MPDLLDPKSALDPQEQENIRQLNRSPHPYHHQSTDLPHLSDRFALRNGLTSFPFSKESTPASDSGTEADDEHLLKGLPAPRSRPHKGLRGRNELVSGPPTPLASPIITEGDGPFQPVAKPSAKESFEKKRAQDQNRRTKIFVRRIVEVCILAVLGWIVQSNPAVNRALLPWRSELARLLLLATMLAILYPLRLVSWAYQYRPGSGFLPVRLPLDFDPADFLYPPTITLLVAALISAEYRAVILPNIVLAISSLPQHLVPKLETSVTYDSLHWILSCLPLAWPLVASSLNIELGSHPDIWNPELLVFVYPLHRTLCAVLYHLTTTSLLTAELQLLSVAMINILILAKSPQVQILRALLWIGGMSVLVFCGPVIRWGIMLARVPKWRLQRPERPQNRSAWKNVMKNFTWRRLKYAATPYDTCPSDVSLSSGGDEDVPFPQPLRVRTLGPDGPSFPGTTSFTAQDTSQNPVARRHTLSSLDKSPRKRRTETPSGRRKRATSISLRPYLKLTHWQAFIRRWLFAAYVYSTIPIIILTAVRSSVQGRALHGEEPIGWALGYLFGDNTWFRFQVVFANLERWITLPRYVEDEDSSCQMGWVQHIRHNDFGEANTRLLLSAYWFAVVLFGLVVVFQLKSTYEVDTRRKVFHFTMVGMFLPTIFVDPTYAAMALSLVLAIFLILDLLRASQLPPLSRPIASFLAPYVDGRDFRGPVVISHIFLLIGCAIPLWLSLAALSRTGSGNLAGWEVPTRDVSMVAGVVCVGLGDAAASLIGRRWGHRKWLWGGGKSLEGSVACAAAVWAGLFVANLWLKIGRWPESDNGSGIMATARDCAVCGSIASLTETVLTGGNDNVVVPVVLWTCVKGLGI